MIRYPAGKTPAQITDAIYNSEALNNLDIGYIDGYVYSMAHRKTCAIFVKETGLISLIPINRLTALFDQEKS